MRLKTKYKILLFSMALMVVFQFNFTMNNTRAVVIDTEDSIYISIPEYVSGVQNIDVYSNLTIQNYNLTLNGTELNSGNVSVETEIVNGTWEPSYLGIVYGESNTGSISDVFEDDTDYFTMNSQSQGFFDVDEYYQVYFYFNEHNFPHDVDTIESLSFYWNLRCTPVGTLEERRIDIYNWNTSSWDSLDTFSNSGWDSGNNSFSEGYSDGINEGYVFRVYAREENSNDIFTIDLDQIVVYYEVNLTVEQPEYWELKDSYAFNSSAFADGYYNLTAWIKDDSDDEYQVTEWIYIDNTDPVLSAIELTPSENITNTERLEILCNITENNDYEVYSYWYDSIDNLYHYYSDDLEQFNLTRYWNNGSWELFIRVQDKAGNVVTDSIEFNVTYDSEIIYIDNPEIVILYQSEKYLDELAFVNITANNYHNISIYKNGTLNQTYTTGSEHSWNITSSTVQDFNITVEIFDENETFYDNISFIISFENESSINITLPGIVISHDAKQYVDANATINLQISNVSNTLLWRNGSNIYNYTDGNHELNQTSSTELIYSYVLEVYDDDANFYDNYTFEIEFINQTVIIVNEPNYNITFTNVSYLPEPLILEIETQNTTAIYIYLNDTLNQTLGGNSSDTVEFNSSIEVHWRIDVIIELTNGTNWTYNFTGAILEIPVIEQQNPSVSIILVNQTYLPEPLILEIETQNTTAIYIYLNDTLNQTLGGNSSDTVEFNSSIEVHWRIDIIIELTNGTNWTYNFTGAILEIPVIDASDPSWILTYPSFVYATGDSYSIILTTDHASGYNITITQDATIIMNETWYDGNSTNAFNIPTNITGINITFDIEIFDIENSSFNNISISIEIKSVPVVYEPNYLILVEVDNKDLIIDLWSNNTEKIIFYIGDDLEEEFEGNQSYVYTVFRLSPATYELSFEIYDASGYLYETEVRNVIVRSDGGGGGGDDDTDTGEPPIINPLAVIFDNPLWLVIILMLLFTTTIIFYINRNSLTKKKTKRKR